MSRQRRSLMAQFRLGILPITVETGRFRNIPLQDRKCTICDLNEVEDEKHFLCICPVYNDIRSTLYTICNYDVWDMTDAYKLGDWMICFVETVFKPLFCEIRYLVYVWTTSTVYVLMFAVTNKPRRAGYAVFTCTMYNVKCIILVTAINKINQINQSAKN